MAAGERLDNGDHSDVEDEPQEEVEEERELGEVEAGQTAHQPGDPVTGYLAIYDDHYSRRISHLKRFQVSSEH